MDNFTGLVYLNKQRNQDKANTQNNNDSTNAMHAVIPQNSGSKQSCISHWYIYMLSCVFNSSITTIVVQIHD